MDKNKKTSNYHISFETFALQPVMQENKISTLVIEQNHEFIIPRKPSHIVRKSCDFYGGSLENATNASRYTLGNRHKTPIIIAHDFGMPFIFLPTMSASSLHNVWISLHAIENIKPDNMGCIIHLVNDRSIKVNVSPTTMHRQYTFGSFLEKDFLKKQRQLNRPSFYNPYDGNQS